VPQIKYESIQGGFVTVKHTVRWSSFTAIAAMLLFSITACGQRASDQHAHPPTTPTHAPISQSLTLKLTPDPPHPISGKAMKLQASVQAGEQPVTDAKVEFEVWKKGNSKHEMRTATMTEKGVYTASYTPMENGEYLIILHVITPQVHQMMDGSVIVGHP
jgi:hypothetical protein